MDVIQPSHSATAARPAHPASIWRNQDFKVVLFGQGISNLGDAVSATTLPLLVLFLTGSGVQMGLVGMLQMVRRMGITHVETAGLDVSEHGMWGYPEFYIPVPGGYGTESHGHVRVAPVERPQPAPESNPVSVRPAEEAA